MQKDQGQMLPTKAFGTSINYTPATITTNSDLLWPVSIIIPSVAQKTGGAKNLDKPQTPPKHFEREKKVWWDFFWSGVKKNDFKVHTHKFVEKRLCHMTYARFSLSPKKRICLKTEKHNTKSSKGDS